MDFNRLSLLSFSFCSIKVTRPNICKKSVCFYCITTSLWRTPVNNLLSTLNFTELLCQGIVDKYIGKMNVDKNR